MYSRLKLSDRERIKEYLDQGYSMRKIDELLGYTHGTTRYEIKHNINEGAEYDPVEAQRLSDERANERMKKSAVLIAQATTKASKELLNYVQSRLDEGLPPEKIINEGNLNISTRSIHRYIHKGLLRIQGPLRRGPKKKTNTNGLDI